jgi:hypothetical protein
MLIYLGYIAWIIFATAILWAGLPSPAIPRKDDGSRYYYLCWGAAVILMFCIQFHFMNEYNLRLQGIVIDSIPVSIFILVYILRTLNKRRKV